MSNSANFSPRIVIVQPGDLSDVILTLPVACSLREHVPHASIHWAVAADCDAILKSHKCVDEVIQLPLRWHRSPAGVLETKASLQAGRFDIALDCGDTWSSALACRLTGAAQRIGLDHASHVSFRKLLLNKHVTPVFDHVVDRRLELLSSLALERPRVQWEWPTTPTDQQWALRYQQRLAGQSFAIIHTEHPTQSNGWPAERSVTTARYMSDRYGVRSVITWTSFEERLKAEQIVALAGDAATLAPDMTLSMATALCQFACHVVAEDSPLLHAANAAGATVLGLYGSRVGQSGVAVRGPYQSHALAFETLGHRRTPFCPDAVQRVGVDHVCQWIDQMQTRVIAKAA